MSGKALKRPNSPATDPGLPPSKLRKKTSAVKVVKDPPVAPPHPSFKHVKAWLTEASEKELDSLTSWLLQRRKIPPTAVKESKDYADALPQAPYKRRAPNEEIRPTGPSHVITGPKVRRKISIHEITAMQKALFPNDLDEPVHRRKKLADRWDTLSMDLQPSKPKKKPVQQELNLPSGVDTCDTLVSKARSRSRVVFLIKSY